MRVPKTPAETPKVEGLEAGAGVHQRKHPLVGRVTGLRQHAWRDKRRFGSAVTASSWSLRAGGWAWIRPPASQITGFTENVWVGLSLLHALFALEHNAICDKLKKHNSQWDDERLFQQARLVNSALLAKIHTVEWSTAILPREAPQARELRTNWYGRFSRLAERVPEARRERHLLRDSRFANRASQRAVHHDRGICHGLHAHADARSLHHSVGQDRCCIGQRRNCPSCRAVAAWSFSRASSPADLFYSFGIHNPGAVRLHNYPEVSAEPGAGQRRTLRPRRHRRPARSRARRAPLQPLPGVAAQGARQKLRRVDRRTEWAAQLKEVYNNDLALVDTMVGMMAEPLRGRNRASARRRSGSSC